MKGVKVGQSVNLLTKDQVERFFRTWECTEPVPRKGKTVYVAFPPGAQCSLATVNWTKMVSTYGKRLYKMTMT